MSDIEEIKSKLRARKVKPHLAFDTGLSTGSTLLNLASSGRPDVGLLRGHYYLLVGDTNSGKTFFTLSLLAEASINPKFDNYRLIADLTEHGALMDKQQHFGKKLVERLEPPYGDKDDPQYSATVEEFYYSVDNALARGEPFVYILDSETGLSSQSEQDKFDEKKEAHEKGKTVTGDYGDGKAKAHSRMLRTVVNRLAETDSILVIVSQTRDNIGFTGRFEPKTFAGGNAIKFYATVQLWTSVKERLKRSVKGKNVQIGINTKIKTKRSRITGREVEVEVPIYWSSGIDDTGSMVQYLIDWGYWKKGSAPDFNIKGSEESIIQRIESEGLRPKLIELVTKVWGEVADACKVERQPRYT